MALGNSRKPLFSCFSHSPIKTVEKDEEWSSSLFSQSVVSSSLTPWTAASQGVGDEKTLWGMGVRTGRGMRMRGEG